MHPLLLKIGSLTIFTYGFFLALAFLAAIALAGREARRVGLPAGRVYDLCFSSIIAALIGARFFHVLLEWPYFQAHPLDMVKLWDGGLAFQGARSSGRDALDPGDCPVHSGGGRLYPGLEAEGGNMKINT